MVDAVFEIAEQFPAQFRRAKLAFGANVLNIKLNGNNGLRALGILAFRSEIAVTVVLSRIVSSLHITGKTVLALPLQHVAFGRIEDEDRRRANAEVRRSGPGESQVFG